MARWFGLLAAAILLLGQGTALHHQHEIVADCPTGPCGEHGLHVDAPTPSGGSLSEADRCPFCELLSQGRTAAPTATQAPAALHDAVVPSAPGTPDAPATPARDPARARAPPRLV
jgi:hypothetical protein